MHGSSYVSSVSTMIPILNISNYVLTKLIQDNYLVWKSLFDHVLKKFDLEDLFYGTNPCPNQYTIKKIILEISPLLIIPNIINGSREVKTFFF